jgi:hypothetical protein
MRRPPSLSDSFYFLQQDSGAAASPKPSLIFLTPPPQAALQPLGHLQKREEVLGAPTPTPKAQQATIFILKGSLHLLFISAFETAFYFLYVNRSENEGILETLNNYYLPLVGNCQTTWSNSTKEVLAALFSYYGVNVTQIDSVGEAAAATRASYNTNLLLLSSLYSAICAGIFGASVGFSKWKKWPIEWRGILIESGLFILLLGLYEVFFFRTIIYNYETISKPELNQYLIDGLSGCLS